MPSDDRFQIIEQLERDALIYDPNYVGIHRTDDLVFIHIFDGRRGMEMKKALDARLATRLAGLSPEDVQVVLSSNGRNDRSFGKGLATYVEGRS